MSATDEIPGACVAVLMGGRSSEREVSLWTGREVLAALRTPASAADARGPARVVEIEIEPSGAWKLFGESRSPAAAVESLPDDALYFLGLHGGEGENGGVQGFLETMGRRYTGSSVGASAACMDKHATRLLLADAGLRVAPGLCFDARRWRTERAQVLERLAALSGAGWVVKPNSGGSSVGTTIVETASELPRAIESAIATGDRALVEARVRGAEATCAVIGNSDGELRALTPVEIVPKAGRFFDYEEKYGSAGAGEFCPPRDLSSATCARLREAALVAHRAAGCDGYSRVDFMVPHDAQALPGEPVVLEINTLPGLTARSLLPKAAAAEGWSFRDLCLEILRLAVARPEAR